MRYLNPLRYIHYHTQLAIPTIYDDSLSFYEIMNKTNLHFNEVINDMNENYEIIDKAFQEVLEQTNKWMEEAKAQADRAEQEANKSQASAEASQQAAEDARNQADRAKSEADAAAASAVEAQKQADRASSEADRAHTEAENAKAQAQAAANSAQESATSAAASADSASESAASATESKNSADASANSASQAAQSATASQNSAEASANSASQAAQSATASQNSAEASANSASQAAQSATDAANSAKDAADTLDEAKKTFVKKAGDTMSGKLTISYGGLSVDGSADISGDLNTGRLQVGKPDDHKDTHLYGNLYLNDMLNMSIGSNVALKFANLQDGLKLYAPLSFEPSPLRISNVGNPQNDFDAVNKITLDSKVTGINAELTDVNNQIAALTTRMGTAERNITKNTSDIASLTNRVTTNETSIININTEITNIKQDITTVEGDYVKKAGDTMTGNLNMGLNQIVMDTGHIAAGNDTLLFEAYSEIDMDNARVSMVGTPVDILDAANKEYVDNAVTGVSPAGKYLPLSGGTMTGIVRFDETADVGVLPDFGFGVQMNSGNVGIVSQAIMHADAPFAADTSMVQHIIKTVGDHKEHDYGGINIKKMSVQGFQEVSFQPRVFVNADPQENYEVATKQYVDQHAGGGGEVVPLDNNLVCYISEMSGGIYKCDCYLIGEYNINGIISAREAQIKQKITHNLNEYLATNNYYMTLLGGDTFIRMDVLDTNDITVVIGSLTEINVILRVIRTTSTSSELSINQNISSLKIGTRLLKKRT